MNKNDVCIIIMSFSLQVGVTVSDVSIRMLFWLYNSISDSEFVHISYIFPNTVVMLLDITSAWLYYYYTYIVQSGLGNVQEMGTKSLLNLTQVLVTSSLIKNYLHDHVLT